jgi:mycothiol synthase
MRRRPYAGPADIALLQAFTAGVIARSGRGGMMHPGDIVHRIFNGLRRDDPGALVHIWEDAGEVIGWALLDPRGGGIEIQLDPARRTSYPGLERAVQIWAEEVTLELMERDGHRNDRIETEVSTDDASRRALLRGLGWVETGEALMFASRRIEEVPPVELPDGYRIRAARGVTEEAEIAALHAAAFGSSWTAELYGRVMRSPGYEAERELLAVAPSGALAAFCVIWPDPVNCAGLFEPLGTHPDHRRRGLGRALLRYGMRELRDRGMADAEIGYEVDNPDSGPLYRSEGFVPTWETLIYAKPISRGS